jgi:hypothetical protein
MLKSIHGSHSHPLDLKKNQKEELYDLKIKTKVNETNFTKWEDAANHEEVEYQHILNRAKMVEINQIPFINQNWFKHVEK